MTDKIKSDTRFGMGGDLSDGGGLGPAGSVTFKNPTALGLDGADRRPGLPVLALLLVAVLLLGFAWSEGREDGEAHRSAGEVVQTR